MRVYAGHPTDLAAVRDAYADGRRLQREQGSAIWPEFGDAAILAEMAAGRLQCVADEGRLVGVFSVAYEDPAIWGADERGAHVYLHRIARASASGSRGLVPAILAWAHGESVRLGRAGLRMDTWSSNAALIAYYQRLGFRVVGHRRVATDAPLPAHYHGVELTLLELAGAGGDVAKSSLR